MPTLQCCHTDHHKGKILIENVVREWRFSDRKQSTSNKDQDEEGLQRATKTSIEDASQDDQA